MTTFTHSMSTAQAIPAGRHSSGQGPTGLLKSWWSAYWRRRGQRATILMLRALDDRSLHDIGLDRSEIESVVYSKAADRRVRFEQVLQ